MSAARRTSQDAAREIEALLEQAVGITACLMLDGDLPAHVKCAAWAAHDLIERAADIYSSGADLPPDVGTKAAA